MSELNNLHSLLTLDEINAIYNSNYPEDEAVFLLKKKCHGLIKKNMTNTAIRKELIVVLGSLHSVTPSDDKCSKRELKASIKRVSKLIEKLEVLNDK